MSTLQLQTNPKIENAFAHIAYGQLPVVQDNGDVDGDWDERKTNAEGYAAFQKVDPGVSYVLVRAPGYQDQPVGPITVPHDDLITVDLVKAPIVLSRLVRIDNQSHRMVNERGEPVYGRGASAFLLFKQWLDGKDITPFLRQHQDLGCNLLRIMGMFESLGGFNPKAYGHDYYDQMPHFVRTVERHGQHSLWTCCAATGAWMNDGEAVDHVKRSVEMLKQTNGAMVSPVNEQGQHNNSIPLDRVAAEVDFGWLLHDMGSYGVDEPCRRPFGTHAVLHTVRRYPSEVKDGNIVDHPNHVSDGLEVGIDEPYRAGDEGSGDFCQEPRVAAEAAGSAYTALFWVFHSMQGERGDVLTGNTLDCARAAFAAMKGH